MFYYFVHELDFRVQESKKAKHESTHHITSHSPSHITLVITDHCQELAITPYHSEHKMLLAAW